MISRKFVCFDYHIRLQHYDKQQLIYKKEDAIKTSQGWWTLSEKTVRVRQFLAHSTTRFEAYISSKARLTQSLEYSRNEQ